jgi:hypothetical protein
VIHHPEMVQAALKAIELFAASHPRPAHVTQEQASEMIGISGPTLRKMIRLGKIRLNEAGKIPITEIDRVLAAREM